MSSFIIEGGHKLNGDITPQGAKNEALEVICATLLTPEIVTINNVPDILDVNNLILLLREIGVKIEHPSVGTYSFQADNINHDFLLSDDFISRCSSLRGSIMDKEQMKQPPKPYEFRSKSAGKRLMIMIAGVLFNFLLALFIYSMVLFHYGDTFLPLQNMKPKPKRSRTYFCTRNVTIVESVSTKVTAAPIPAAVSIFFETPRNGHIPRNCDSTILFTNTAAINIIIYSMISMSL